MENKLSAFGMGARVLTQSEAQNIDLGPLAKLEGTWKGQPFDGWNVIAVPGAVSAGGFVLEVIPYEETLTFTPVVVAGNRGPFINGVQEEQHLVGLMYEQTVTSVCDTPQCINMGFGSGNIIHAETGIFLNITDFNSGFNIARLSTIPHGNSVLALGNSVEGAPANNNFIDPSPTTPKPVPGGPSLPFGYGEAQYLINKQFPNFPQTDPNSFLTETLGTEKINDMTTLILSTNNKDGGILNIPFIQQNVNATQMDSIFWIESLENPVAGEPDILQLQYTQTINLVFPATGTTQPVIWPHVTINTMRKVDA
jgi:hypothetical protein